jgi:CRISPR system Cascade subunit CasE
MYISRVELDLTRRSTMAALSAPQRMHGAVESCFSGERQRRLWRLDRLGGKLYLLVLSKDRPDLSGLARQFGRPGDELSTETRDYTPLLQRIEPESEWRFRLTANPTKSCLDGTGSSERGIIRAHCTAEYQKQWLLERAQKHGFQLEEKDFTVTSSRWMHFSKGRDSRRMVSLLSVTFEGILHVEDADLFRQLLTNGMGRGKAYGLGLMTVMRPGGKHG